MLFSLSLPVVRDQLLCFVDVEMEIVVLVPKCQGCDLLSVGHLIITGDQAYMMISRFDDGVGAVGGHAVMSEQGVEERTEHQPVTAHQEVQDPITD